MAGPGQVYKSPVAKSIPYDDTVQNPLSTKTDVQAMLDFLKNTSATSASPGFSYGRSGNSPEGTWLQNDSVPSNLSGRTVGLQSAIVEQVFIANETPDIFTIGIYHHEGNSVNLTLVGTVTTLAQRSNSFEVSFSIPTGKQLATRVETGSTKNIVIGVQLKGSIT